MSRSADSLQCDQVLELLEAHLDGDLSRDEARAVVDHLADCRGCAREAALAEAVRSELRAMPSFDAPPELLAAVRWAAGSQRPRRRRLRPALAVAAALMVAVIAGVLWTQGPGARPSMDDPEIARATAETRYALALIGQLSRRAELDELLAERMVTPTLRGLARVLGPELDNRGDQRAAEPETTTEQGGRK
jgi:anti-sigma factor (TIGR02949 family)